MDAITELTTLNFSTIIIGIFIILSAIIAVYEMVGKISVIIGKPIKKYKQREEDHRLVMENAKTIKQLTEDHKESVKQSIRHDEMIKNDLDKLTDTVTKIKNEVVSMRVQIDEDKLAEYKDKIGESYRFYSMRKYSDKEPIPYLNHMEKEALRGLITQYESHGGRNSFVHSKVEPEMETWKVID